MKQSLYLPFALNPVNNTQFSYYDYIREMMTACANAVIVPTVDINFFRGTSHLMSTPLITIGMTCYNSADTIGRAIDSALAQDWPNFEIVIVDDCSRDNSVDVIRGKVEGNEKIRFLPHEKNKGFAGALNTLIAEARGEFLAIFDDDDVSDPKRLSKQYARITEYEAQTDAKLVVCHCARTQNYPDGSQVYEPTAGCVTGIAPSGRDMADRILTGRLSAGVTGSCANCSRMARLSTFRAVDGFDSTLRRCEDTDFNIRLALAGGHFLGIKEPLVSQTMTGGSDKTIDVEYVAEKAVLQKHKSYLDSIGWYGFCEKWLDVRFNNLRGKKADVAKGMIQIFLSHPLMLTKKIIWTLPAYKTRARWVKWYKSDAAKAVSA